METSRTLVLPSQQNIERIEFTTILVLLLTIFQRTRQRISNGIFKKENDRDRGGIWNFAGNEGEEEEEEDEGNSDKRRDKKIRRWHLDTVLESFQMIMKQKKVMSE